MQWLSHWPLHESVELLPRPSLIPCDTPPRVCVLWQNGGLVTIGQDSSGNYLISAEGLTNATATAAAACTYPSPPVAAPSSTAVSSTALPSPPPLSCAVALLGGLTPSSTTRTNASFTASVTAVTNGTAVAMTANITALSANTTYYSLALLDQSQQQVAFTQNATAVGLVTLPLSTPVTITQGMSYTLVMTVSQHMG